MGLEHTTGGSGILPSYGDIVVVDGPNVDAAPAVFEDPAPVPAAPDARRRVSNRLYEVLDEVTRLEGDFEYQYKYNEELIDEVAAANKEAAEAKKDAAQVRACLTQAENTARLNADESLYWAEQFRRTRDARKPRVWIAVIGWVLAALGGGVLIFEKSTATPIDKAVREAIIWPIDATN